MRRAGTRHFSDFFQLFVLQIYGGVYFDADQVLLRDMFPLWGMHFEYQWSFDVRKFNNAVQGLTKGHGDRLIRHGGKLDAQGCCTGWGNTLWSAKSMAMSPQCGSVALSRVMDVHAGPTRAPMPYPAAPGTPSGCAWTGTSRAR